LDFSASASRRIDSLLDLLDASISISHNGKPTKVTSPFSSEALVMQSQLPQLFDRLTVVSANRFEGRVDINHAPREVLLGVPGIDEGHVERILGARSMSSNDDPSRRHPCWLLTQGVVDVPTMRRLLPNLNSGGDVFRAEFWGSSGPDGLSYRFEAVIDAADKVASTVYFRELPAIGWPAVNGNPLMNPYEK
jgi:hypothetical protein